jgi:hypothetical protein
MHHTEGNCMPSVNTQVTNADASILPNVPSGNTMAPCVVIGERAAEIIKEAYGIGSRT